VNGKIKSWYHHRDTESAEKSKKRWYEFESDAKNDLNL
jgi:hypothetical protein